MAQTIGMSRGNSSVYGNGSSLTPFYTQSGGSATRVIVNALAGWGQQTQYNYPGTLALVYTPSGGSAVILGWATRYGYAGNVQFMSAGSGPSGGISGNSSSNSPRPLIGEVVAFHGIRKISGWDQATVSV
jgi:hypothetical protein